MIRAVTLFGDPTYVPSDPFNAPGSPSGHSILGRLSSQSAALAAYKFMGWPQGSSSQGWVYKIREYCLAGDAVCQSGSGANAWAIHNSYRPVKTTNAKSWIEYMLTSSN